MQEKYAYNRSGSLCGMNKRRKPVYHGFLRWAHVVGPECWMLLVILCLPRFSYFLSSVECLAHVRLVFVSSLYINSCLQVCFWHTIISYSTRPLDKKCILKTNIVANADSRQHNIITYFVIFSSYVASKSLIVNSKIYVLLCKKFFLLTCFKQTKIILLQNASRQDKSVQSTQRKYFCYHFSFQYN